MEDRPFRQRYLRIAVGTSLLTLVVLAPVMASADSRNIDLEFIYHDGTPAWDIFLYPYLDSSAVGVFCFPIENDGWEWIDFRKVRFYHKEETGRPFRILLIRRDFEDEEYEVVCGDSVYYETTCTDCWEEVDIYCQAELFMGSFNRCFGIFVNIVRDYDIPWDCTFSLWSDPTVDHPYSSAIFWNIDDDWYQDVPWYNSEEGWGEYLIEIYATLQGTTPTGETTFSEIKLMYGDR